MILIQKSHHIFVLVYAHIQREMEENNTGQEVWNTLH